MKDDKIKDLIKNAYEFEPVPGYLWQRIVAGTKKEQARPSVGAGDIDFEMPGENTVETQKKHDIHTQAGGNMVALKSGGTRKYRRIITSVAAAAACIALCLTVLFGSGIIKRNNVQPGEDVDDNAKGQSVFVENAMKGNIPWASIMAGDKIVEYEASLAAYESGKQESGSTVQINNPFEALHAKTGDISEYTQYGRWVTMGFGENVPDEVSVVVETYDMQGNPQTMGISDVDSDIAGNAVNFRVEKNIPGWSSDSNYYLQDFYQMYTVSCKWTGDEPYVVEADYYFTVKVGTPSERFTATVMQSSPELVVDPGRDSWMYNEKGITLTDYVFVHEMEDGSREETSSVPEPGDSVTVLYFGTDFNEGFPGTISGVSVVVNQEPAVNSSTDLRTLLEGFGAVDWMVYTDVSMPENSDDTDEQVVNYYELTDDAGIEEVLKYLALCSGQMSVTEIEAAIFEGYDDARAAVMMTDEEVYDSAHWMLEIGYDGAETRALLRFTKAGYGNEERYELIAVTGDKEYIVLINADSGESIDRLQTQSIRKCFSEVSLDEEGTMANITSDAITAGDMINVVNENAAEQLETGDGQYELQINSNYSIDIDGDGLSDEVYVDYSRKVYYADSNQKRPRVHQAGTVIINGVLFDVSKYGIIFPDETKFFIVDLDTNDNYMEIALCDNGPSSDPQTFFFRYINGELVHMGTVEEHPGNEDTAYKVELDGNGKIYTMIRLGVLQTWWAPAEYSVISESEIAEVKPEYYRPDMNWTVIAIQELNLHETASPDSPQSIVIPAGTEVTFPLTDNEGWLFVRAADGTEGWLSIDNSSYELFGGLQMYD